MTLQFFEMLDHYCYLNIKECSFSFCIRVCSYAFLSRPNKILRPMERLATISFIFLGVANLKFKFSIKPVLGRWKIQAQMSVSICDKSSNCICINYWAI